MQNNFVVDGMNVKELLQSLHEMLSAGTIDNQTIVVIDTYDGYRHGIEKVFCENSESLTFGAKIHEEVCC
jgi:hypothetical protein